MNITVVGTGYVGLVVGSCLAECGNEVICVDIDTSRIANLKQGRIPIFEPGLTELIQRNTREERLQFSTNLKEAARRSLVIFICVGTPTTATGAADVTAVYAVAEAIGQSTKGYKVVVTKSTVPVGTTSKIHSIIKQHTAHEFDVISNPEFLKQGAAVQDFMKPDRVIIGASATRGVEVLRELYAPFVRTGSPILLTDIQTAELTKYAANACLATRISFMNEVANLCERVGADIDMVRSGLAHDARIGPAFLFAGIGYGGSCFPKDVKALIHTGLEHGYAMNILQAVDDVNQRQPLRLIERLREHYGSELKGKRFAIWGLSFKPQTNDMREAPSIRIIEELLAANATVVAYDPEAANEAEARFGKKIDLAKNQYGCLEYADALLLLTEWQVFRNPNFDRMKSMMRFPVIFDGRNIFDPVHLRSLGFTYYGIGRQ